MKTTVIAVCKQTHPECQGFAADDHIRKECYSVILTPESEDQILSEIKRIEEESEKELDKATKLWQVNHPDENECTCEGDEFVGLIWVEMSDIDETDTPPTHYKNGTEVLEILKQIKPSHRDN